MLPELEISWKERLDKLEGFVLVEENRMSEDAIEVHIVIYHPQNVNENDLDPWKWG